MSSGKFKGSFWSMPGVTNLNFTNNLGFMLFIMVVVQIFTGMVLVFHYNPELDSDNMSRVYDAEWIMNKGYLFRMVHVLGAMYFFLFLYGHIGRGLYIMPYVSSKVWFSGMVLLAVSYLIGFTGYVLPWGQLSYWGLVVAMNIIKAIPVVGPEILLALCGKEVPSEAILMRIFILHVLLPFVLCGLVMMHLLLLHGVKSSNPLGFDRVLWHPLHPDSSTKDAFMASGLFFVLLATGYFMDSQVYMGPANMVMANPMVTPLHIEPEWYFLWMYALMRSVDSKVMGLFMVGFTFLNLALAPIFKGGAWNLARVEVLAKPFFFWLFVVHFIMLSMMGLTDMIGLVKPMTVVLFYVVNGLLWVF